MEEIIINRKKIKNKIMLLVLTENNSLSIIGCRKHNDHDQRDVIEDLMNYAINEICCRREGDPMSSALSSLVEDAWERAAENDPWFYD